MQLDIQMLLDSFETPAIFYRENTVRYFNQWAKTLFPSLTAGKGLPDNFDAPDSLFVPEVHTMQRGTLYLLRHRTPAAGADMAQVVRELRACLTTLTAANDSLSTSLQNQASPETMRLLELSNQNLHRLRRLTDHSDLLRQMEARSPNIYREAPVDLAALCRELSAHVSQLASRAGAVFRLDCAQGSLPMLGDAALLQRMLLNLISNSLKATNNRGELSLRLEKKGSRAIFTFRDNGPGIETQRLLCLFQPQTRRHRLPEPESGAAMGLRLVREVAVLHQGLIVAENHPSGGVSITISLPIRKPALDHLHSAPAWGDDGFHLVLTELSDALPSSFYSPEDLNG